MRCRGRLRQEQGGRHTSPRCPRPSPGHNHCDSALAKMHRLVEVTVSAYFDINVNVSPTVSQPVCVCVCPAVSCPVPVPPGGLHGAGQALPNLPPRVLPASGSCAQPHPCSSFNSRFPPTPVWGCFCLFSLLSPCRCGCCTQPCEHGAAGEGDWFILALDRTSAGVRFPSDLSLMALEQTGSAHPHAIPAHSQPAKRPLEFHQSRGVGRNSASLPACLSHLRLSHLPPAPPPAPGNRGQTVQTAGSSGTGGPGEIKCTIAAVPCLWRLSRGSGQEADLDGRASPGWALSPFRGGF